MTNSGSQPFLFVHHDLKRLSQRDRELQDSERRSHAAKISSHRVKSTSRVKRIRHYEKAVRVKSESEEDERASTSKNHFSTSDPSSAELPETSMALVRPNLPGLSIILNQGHNDPFNTSVVQNIPPDLQYALNYAYEVLWPAITLNTISSNNDHSLVTWRRRAVQKPFLFHGHVAAAATISTRFYGQMSRSMSAFHDYHRRNAVELLNVELENMKGLPSDELIMAILTMAAGVRPVDSEFFSLCDQSASPLAKAQNIHIYSSMSVEPEYVQAVFTMLAAKGGLDGLEMAGLAETIEAFDIMIATVTGTPPSCPWRHSIHPINHNLDKEARTFAFTCGSGFEDLGNQPLLHVLRLASALTVAIDHYHRGGGGADAPKYRDLVHARNATQHALCSLRRPNPMLDLETTIFDACRLGVLIYSDFMIYPIPPSVGVRERLTFELIHTLKICDRFRAWERYPCLLLWITTMGAMAATSPIVRVTIINVIKMNCSHPYKSWNDVRQLLLTFLWWDPVFDKLGSAVWNDILQPPFDSRE